MENWKEEKVTLFPRRLFLRLAALALAAVLALGLTACDSLPGSGGHIVKPSTGSSQPFEMHFIDVGQALSVLVECDGQFMLYDGGNVDDGSLVVSYLQKQGVVIYALSDFIIMILSWLVKQSLRAFLFQEVQP